MKLLERPPRLMRFLMPGALWRLDTGGAKEVALTFDDGPIPEVTPWVLDRLKERGIRATFFMVGENATRHPYLVERIHAEGHRIGNHTMHHLQGILTTTKRYVADVESCNRLLCTALMRPPHGWLRLVQAWTLRKRYQLVMYDLVTRDYSRRLNAEQVLENVKKLTRPGSIIVFHDSLKSWPRLQTALPSALDWLLEQGYGFTVIGGEK